MRLRIDRWLAVLGLALLGACAGRAPLEESDSMAAGFTLGVRTPSGLGGARAYRLELTPRQDRLELVVRAAGARGLKAAYFTLSYDAQRFTPLSARAGAALKSAGSPVLELLVTPRPGEACFGAVLVRPQEQAGFSGDGELARLYFERRVFNPPRRVSAPPIAQSAAADLAFDAAASVLSWSYRSPGDYDQNGEVNIADLTPLGLHFGESSAGEGFAVDGIQSVIDADGNGEINISDITAIGANFGLKLVAFNVYASADAADKPIAPDVMSTLSPLDRVEFSTAQGGAAEQRLRFFYTVAAPPADFYYWVRPLDGEQEGTASQLGGGPPSPAEQPPLAAFTVDSTFGPPPLTVHFDAAGSKDPEGKPLRYSWDFDGDGVYDEVDSDKSDTSHEYSLTGYYWPSLQVLDAAGFQSVASTAVGVFSGPVIPPDLHPPVVQYQGLNPRRVLVTALCSDADGTIEQYDWDWTDDGSYDSNSGADPHNEHDYTVAGSHTMRIRATDNDGATDEVTATVSVPELHWVIYNVDSAENDVGKAASLALVQRNPAVAYYDDDEDDLLYKRANDENGASWGSQRRVAMELDNGRQLSLAVVDNNPAIAYVRHSPVFAGENGDLMYVRAMDSTGAAWPASQRIYGASSDAGQFPSLAVVAGAPAISFYKWGEMALMFIQAADATGAGWNRALYLDHEAGETQFSKLLDLAGQPAVAYLNRGSGAGHYTRGLVPRPAVLAQWSRAVVVGWCPWPSALSAARVGGGYPALAYREFYANALVFKRANDELGYLWPDASVVLDSQPEAGRYVSMCMVSGVPCVAYYDDGPDDLRFRAALNPDGSAWGAAQTVDSAGDVGRDCSLIQLSSWLPAIAYYDASNGNLKFARMI